MNVSKPTGHGTDCTAREPGGSHEKYSTPPR